MLFNDLQFISCTTSEGKQLADELEMAFIETSALNRKNIDEAFYALSQCKI
jgi:hypothetical protein